jgi:hypothetical protein
MIKSRWIEHKGTKILKQDFANLFFNSQAVKNELTGVQEIVLNEPANSVLVLSDFTNTQITGDLMTVMNQASRITKPFVKKTAVLGITGIKRTFGDLLSRITGQPLVYFTNEAEALEWLTNDQ